ncbi:MAG: ABC transporter substrate-binding protein [Candidatus Heimdallarchaeota archaeon]|nr:ABC transporter substrate-binding protein [Candidatus Heimdallarchaeota archaeon]
MNKKFVSLSMLAMTFLLATSMIPNSTAAVNVNVGSTVVFGMPYDFFEYSVYTGSSYASAQWQSAVNNGLYGRSSAADRDWAPDLAASLPIVSADKKTFTVDLKADLEFSNGDPLTAEDVAFSFKVAMTPAINLNFYGSYVGFMNNDSVVIIDSDTVEITLLQTFAFPFTFLSTPLVPEETYGDIYASCLAGTAADCVWDSDDLTFAIGAGPYLASDYDGTNQVITVVKNDRYHGWTDGSGTGNVDTIVFKKTLEKAAAIAELVEGRIDIMDAQYIPGLDELAFFGGITEVFIGDPAHQEISLNHLHPMYGTGVGLPGLAAASEADQLAAALKVRTAMSHIVDREFAANEISDGLAQPAATSMPSAALGWDETLIPLAFDINVAKTLMEAAGFDYSTLTDSNNDGVYETSFFEVTVLSPNTNPARNEWSAGYVLELPKIGIGVKEHVSTGWAEIIPRTFGWTGTGTSLVPLYADEGFDVFFVGYSWGLDWNPQGLYDPSGRHDTTGGGNFYNFDVDGTQTDVATLLNDYLSELDFTARVTKVKALQAELYENKPVLPILYPQSHWGFNEDLGNIDALLLSVTGLEWQLVTKEVAQTTAPDVVTSTETGEVTTVTESTPIDFINVLMGLFSVGLIATFYNRKRR